MVEIRDAITNAGLPPTSLKVTSIQLHTCIQTEESTLVLESDLKTLLSRGETATAGASFSARFHQNDLLKIAKHILQVLDPTPEDQILQHLKNVEHLLKTKQSHQS